MKTNLRTQGHRKVKRMGAWRQAIVDVHVPGRNYFLDVQAIAQRGLAIHRAIDRGHRGEWCISYDQGGELVGRFFLKLEAAICGDELILVYGDRLLAQEKSEDFKQGIASIVKHNGGW